MQTTTLLQQSEPQPSDQLRNLTLRLYDAMARADIDFVAANLSTSDQVRVIGTDPREWWSGHARVVAILRAQMQEMGGFPIVAGSPEAFEDGNVGWIADSPSVRLPEGELPMRITLVARREAGAWKIIQWHVSLGVNNEEALGKDLPLE